MGNGPRSIAMSEHGLYAYVTNRLSDTISVIHLATRQSDSATAAESHAVPAGRRAVWADSLVVYWWGETIRRELYIGVDLFISLCYDGHRLRMPSLANRFV